MTTSNWHTAIREGLEDITGKLPGVNGVIDHVAGVDSNTNGDVILESNQKTFSILCHTTTGGVIQFWKSNESEFKHPPIPLIANSNFILGPEADYSDVIIKFIDTDMFFVGFKTTES